MSVNNADSRQSQAEISSQNEAVGDNYSLSDLSSFTLPASKDMLLHNSNTQSDIDDEESNIMDDQESALTIDMMPQTTEILTENSVVIKKKIRVQKVKKLLSESEVAYNLFVRRIVDETLDRRLPLSQQSRRKLTLIESLCSRQFPQIESIRHRTKIRAYLKLCRRNIKKNNGVIALKTAHQSCDSARQIMLKAYENAQDDIYELHEICPPGDSNIPSRSARPRQRIRSKAVRGKSTPPTIFAPGTCHIYREPFIQTFSNISNKMISDTAKALTDCVWSNSETSKLLLESLTLSANYLLQSSQ